MVKYTTTMVTFEEIPDKVTLSIAISNCKGRCKGCHSPELRNDIGKELSIEELDRLIEKEKGINCVLFLGEGNDKDSLLKLSEHVRNKYNGIMTALYSGREEVEEDIINYFNYIKIGSYKAEFGPLNKKTTNQRLYKIEGDDKIDITYRFWKVLV